MIRARLTTREAETIALNGLAFLAAQPEEIERFLRNSGLDAAELRLRAADPDVLRGVLEYILAGDATTTGFCAEQGLDLRVLHDANRILSGTSDL